MQGAAASNQDGEWWQLECAQTCPEAAQRILLQLWFVQFRIVQRFLLVIIQLSVLAHSATVQEDAEGSHPQSLNEYIR